jgi:hypothetical protein
LDAPYIEHLRWGLGLGFFGLSSAAFQSKTTIRHFKATIRAPQGGLLIISWYCSTLNRQIGSGGGVSEAKGGLVM